MKFNKQMAMLGLGIIASTNVLAQTFYQCMPCPAGSYASGGKCVSCPTTDFKWCGGNIFCLGKTESECKKNTSSWMGCRPQYGSAGYVVNATKTGCEKCPAGTGLDITKSTCIPCPPGTYASNGICTTCPAGQYQDKTGQTSCITCPAGKYPNDSHTACNLCPAGNYCVDGIKHECEPGYYQTATGATSCNSCQQFSMYIGSGGRNYGYVNICNGCKYNFNIIYECTNNNYSNAYCSAITSWGKMGPEVVAHGNDFVMYCYPETGQVCLEELDGAYRKHCYN